MHVPRLYVEPQPLDSNATLETVLAAWHEATLRLQETHEALRSEVGRLTAELDSKNRELARKTRLEDLGRIASHVAHEVRNSLMPLTLYLSLLRRRLAPDAAGLDLLDKIDSSLTTADATVNDLLHFAADREPVLRPVRLYDVVADVFAALAPQLAAQGITTVIDVPRDLHFPLDRDMFRRAVLNLSLNALDVMSGGGGLTATTYLGPHALEFELADDGPGIDASLQPRVFEPFFTTKSAGTGLGLAIVERIAAAHGGTIRVQNCPEGGAAFTLTLPRQAQERAA